MARFTLFISFLDKTIEKPLPAENDRSIRLDLSEIIPGCSIGFEVFDNEWTVFSDEQNRLRFEERDVVSHILADGDVIKVQTVFGASYVIMAYEINDRITRFRKFAINDRNIVRIGKGPESDIFIDSAYISTEHAVLENRGGKWIYRDYSLNGSYINGARAAQQTELVPFDIISAVGIKIVFLGDCLAINREDIVRTNLIPIGTSAETGSRMIADSMFSRSPRTVEPLFDEVIEIEAPPAPNRSKPQPFIFVIGPSITMPLPILFSTIINNQLNGGTGRSPLGMVASVGMSALVGACWAVAHYKYNQKVIREDEKFRIEAYQEYITNNELLIREKQNYDNSVLVNQYLSSSDIILKLTKDNTFLWNRNIHQEDFLTVRVGTGNVDFGDHIAVPDQRFSLHKDDMMELPHKLFDKYRYMHDAVVTLSLKENGIIGMLGDDKAVDRTAVSLMVQVAALHCYTDVRIAAFFKEKEYSSYSWLRWLPHTSSEDMKFRLTACDSASCQNVLYHLDEVIRRRIEKLGEDTRDSDGEGMYPHYIVLCTDRELFEDDGIEKYIPLAKEIGFTFILAYKRLDRLPNECSRIIQCADDFTGVYDLCHKRGATDRVEMDSVRLPDAEWFAKTVSRLRVREYSTGEIPGAIDYFDMIGIGRLEHWNLIKKYKENRVYEGIKSFVGIGNGGKPVYIDIHEKKYGPHGLVAGTTGSGKSETLQTFIISLALNYHPDEVAFILIDYKGGGMAFAFDGMPHVAGMITNLGGDGESGELDSSVTRRALVSIRSEIKRRQTIFNKYKVNHIDAYIRLFRDGTADEPLPHLIIISDEFAELKKEQPEFIKELVSTARVGRSLGIHLILATQKPGGVVDEEIWSNSRFKLCLRVQDKADSMGMLKRPDAAYLTQTGRAYLQIGNDEIFEQFQTGYSGADYQPKDTVGTASESDLYMMNIDGSAAVSRERRVKKDSSGKKQLKAAVDYIIDVCSANGIRNARALWLSELDKYIVLDRIMKEYAPAPDGISAVFGVIDDPERQRQFPAVIDLSACSNLIITGIAGIGKTTMLQTMLVSLMERYTCEQVNYYILDFSSRTLKMFSEAPHCGLAAFSDDREAVTRLFGFVKDEIARRKDLFNAEFVGSYNEYIRRNKLPLMLVIVDNFYSFNELYPELSEDFLKISRDCAKYGIQMIITCNNLGDIRYKLRQNFVNAITMVMADKPDYREAWGVSADFLPKSIKGRGLIMSEGRLLEYQTALPVEGESESDRHDVITDLVGRIAKRDASLRHANRIRTLPLGQSFEEFYAEAVSDEFMPVGYKTDDISIYGINYKDNYCYAVSEASTKGISLVLNNMLYAIRQSGFEHHIIKLRSDIKLDIENGENVYRGLDGVTELFGKLKDIFVERFTDRRSFLNSNPDGDTVEYILGRHKKVFVVIDSFSEFISLLTNNAAAADTRKFVETTFEKGMGVGIYFVSGFDQETYSTSWFTDGCKSYAKKRRGIHLGGRYDKQKLVEVTLPVSQQSKPADWFSGVSNDNGGEIKVFIPGAKNEE